MHSQFCGSAALEPGSAGVSVSLARVTQVVQSYGGPAYPEQSRAVPPACRCMLAVSQVSRCTRSLAVHGLSHGHRLHKVGLEAAGQLSRSHEASGGLCWALPQGHFSALSVSSFKQVTRSAQLQGVGERKFTPWGDEQQVTLHE